MAVSAKKIQACLNVVSQQNTNLFARLRAEKRRAEPGRANSVCFVEDELLARIITRNRHGKSEASNNPNNPSNPPSSVLHLPLPALNVWSFEMPQTNTKADSDAASSNAERTIKTCHCVAKIAGKRSVKHKERA